MASIYKRKLKNGGFSWRVVVRIKGFPTACDSFERKQEAEDWALKTEREIKLGQFKLQKHKRQHTYGDLFLRLRADGILEHYRSLQNAASQFDYWNKRLSSYALIHITPELVAKERQELINTQGARGIKRSPATINRYMAVLSSTFGYAIKQLRWLDENPCAHLLRLKTPPPKDRVISNEEIGRLLEACRSSQSPYLYCIVLIAITTGARRGEILGLEWSHIDFENRLAHLKITKNGRPRSIALVDPVVAELRKLYEKREPHKSLVFASKTAFGRIDIKKGWNEALKRAGIEKYNFHSTRHQFCTLAASQGASNMELAACMGHATLSQLLRYTSLDVNVTKRFSAAISAKILPGHAI